MRKLKAWWRHGLPSAVAEELEHWLRVLLTVGAALLLYAALRAQVGGAAELPTHPMAAAASSTPRHDAFVRAVLAPGMPPRSTS